MYTQILYRKCRIKSMHWLVAFFKFYLLRYSIRFSFPPLLYIQKAVIEPSRSHSAAFLLPEKREGGLKPMALKITPKQRKEINALVRRSCCNCYKGNCLLLDDGEETKCVQFISRYGIYCNYFLKAVLPAEKELYAEILWQNGING